jgi:hypothetical protein
LNDTVAAKYSLPVVPILFHYFSRSSGKRVRNFRDINLQVDGLKKCLSHKATARRVEGVRGCVSCAPFLSGEVQRASK